MLEQLVAYAEHRGLQARPGFSPKEIRWAIRCHSRRGYLGVVELGDTGDKRNKGRRFACCPDLTQPEMIAGWVTRSHFLADTAAVVAGLGVAEDDTKARDKHAFFVELLRLAGNGLPHLARLAEILEDPATLERIRRDLEERRAKTSDKVTLELDGRFLLEDSDWHSWWEEFRAGLPTKGKRGGGRGKKAGPQRMVCLVTGQVVEPELTHPKVKGLEKVGGRGSGSALISFDKESFQSYGLKKSANAATSEWIAKAYVEALNDLLRRGVHLSGTVVAYWYQEPVAEEDDLLDLVLHGGGGSGAAGGQQRELDALRQARALLQAVRSGRRPELLQNRYYALTLSGAAGRVMVRDWMEGGFEELARNVVAWFEDLEIIAPDGLGSAPPPKLPALLAALFKPGESFGDRRLTHLEVALWRSAVTGRELPREVLAQAVHRARNEVVAGQAPYPVRMGLIKACLRRREQGGMKVSPNLYPEHPEPAYHCGRLLAVLSRLQNAALKNVKAGVVQRYYGAASTTPARVLGRLIGLSNHHLAKMAGEGSPGLARWFEKQIAEIMGRLKDTIPRTLTLEEQGLFALGYYQQLAHKSNDETQEDPDAPAGEQA